VGRGVIKNKKAKVKIITRGELIEGCTIEISTEQKTRNPADYTKES